MQNTGTAWENGGLDLQKMRSDLARFGSASKVALAAGVPTSTVTRILRGETRPSLATVFRLAVAVRCCIQDWITRRNPSDWQRLDTASSGVYPQFVDEMMNSHKVVGFGRNLHCYLLPAEAMLEVSRAELEAARVTPGIVRQRVEEELLLIDKLHEKCQNEYRFESYRALGVAESLLTTLGNAQGRMDEIVANLDADRGRGVLGLVSDETFTDCEQKLYEITGLARFSSLTVLDTYRVIAWTDSGVFFNEQRSMVDRVHSYLTRSAFSYALGFENDWEDPDPSTMKKVTRDVSKYIRVRRAGW